MPRTPGDKKKSARKYGRRRAVLEAAKSAKDLDAASVSDVTRRSAAVWAIVRALEELDARAT